MVLASLFLFGQVKPPVARDDHASTQAGIQIRLNVLENDYCLPNHTIKIFMAAQTEHGFCEYTDSTISYTPYSFYAGIDSISYIIQDQDNQLFSDPARMYITVNNNGFAWLDINNWHARINAFGNHFWDFDSHISSEIPAGSGCGTIFNSTLWI